MEGCGIPLCSKYLSLNLRYFIIQKLRHTVLFLLVGVIGPLITKAQSAEVFGDLVYEHDQLYDQGLFGESLKKGKEALDLGVQLFAPNDTNLIYLYNGLSNACRRSGRLPEASIYIQKATNAIEASTGTVPTGLKRVVWNNAGRVHFNLGQWDRAYTEYQVALDYTRQEWGKDHYRTAGVLANMGQIDFRQKRYDQALAIYLEALEVYRNDPQTPVLYIAYLYTSLGNIHLKRGEPHRALPYYQRTQDMFTEEIPPGDSRHASAHLNVSAAYEGLGRYPEAIHSAKLALRQMAEVAIHRPAALANLASLYQGTGQIDSAIIYQKQAIDKTPSSGPLPSQFLMDRQEKLASLYMENQQVGVAFQHWQAYAELLNTFPNSRPEVQYYAMAQMGITHPNVARGHQLMQEVATYWQESFTPQHFSALKTRLKTAPILLRHIRHQVRETPKKALFDQGWTLIEEARSIFAQWQKRYTDETTLQLLNTHGIALMEEALELLYLHPDLKESRLWQNRLLQLMEWNRATTLLARSRLREAFLDEPIPGPLFQKEQSLRQQLEDWSQSPAPHEEWVDSLMHMEDRLSKVQEQIRQVFPGYDSLRFGRAPVHLREVQAKLRPSEQLTSFFWGQKTCFALHVGSSYLEIVRVSLTPSIHKSLDDYLEVLQQPTSVGIGQVDSLGSLIRQTFLPTLADSVTQLIVLPDGPLTQIPFAALPQPGIQSLRSAPSTYLLHQSSVYYCWSVSNWLQTSSSRGPKSVLAMAPDFSRANAPLFFNRQEADHLKKEWKARVLYGEQASRSFFLRLAPDYQILHLATHAYINPQNSNYSYLVFSEHSDAQQIAPLYVKDIYQLQLQTDLVVLSACQTTQGNYRTQEGLLSLARGFSYAGAQSLVGSLWPLNDQTTVRIIPKMYQYLAQGLTKDKALQQAKLDYLHSAIGRERHPIYWAGLQVIGDVRPVTPSADHSRIRFLLSFLLVMLTVGWIIWRRQRNRINIPAKGARKKM